MISASITRIMERAGIPVGTFTSRDGVTPNAVHAYAPHGKAGRLIYRVFDRTVAGEPAPLAPPVTSGMLIPEDSVEFSQELKDLGASSRHERLTMLIGEPAKHQFRAPTDAELQDPVEDDDENSGYEAGWHQSNDEEDESSAATPTGFTDEIEHVAPNAFVWKVEDRSNDDADEVHAGTAAGHTTKTDPDAPNAFVWKVENRSNDDADEVHAGTAAGHTIKTDPDAPNDDADEAHAGTAAGHTTKTDHDAPKALGGIVERRPDDDAILVEAVRECPAGDEEITEGITILGTFYKSVTQVDGVSIYIGHGREVHGPRDHVYVLEPVVRRSLGTSSPDEAPCLVHDTLALGTTHYHRQMSGPFQGHFLGPRRVRLEEHGNIYEVYDRIIAKAS